jgi:hypothetical protein
MNLKGGGKMHKLNVFGRVQRALTKKNFLVAGVFVLALAGAISLGHATKQSTSAASSRDCSVNSVNYKPNNGGCGALSPQELIADVRQNDPGDLQATYDHFGLNASKYDRFASEAVQGVAKADGTVWVNGQKVMDNAWSIGRTKFWYSQNYQIGGTMFYKSNHTQVLQGKDHDVMVMFDDNGTAESVIMNACGNGVGGDKVPTSAACKQLNMTSVEGKKNTYRFTTDVEVTGNAQIQKVVYTFSDGTTVEKANGNEAVEHTFAKSGTAKVEIHVKLPNGKIKVIKGDNCVKQITVKIPVYLCEMLIATALNDKKTQFRFTVKTRQENAVVKSVDFTLNGSNTTNGVVTKDAQGNIYKDYTFAEDGKSHKVVAKVNFDLEGEVASKTCEATVTSTKAPVCEVPGKEMFPPNAPECAWCPVPGKEKLPKDSPNCKEAPVPPAELPKTGMGNIIGMFAGTTIAGAAAHRVVTSRRRR